MNDQMLDAALRPISQALESDGYVVGVELAGGAVRMSVTAGPDACAECLVPKTLMTELVVQALGDAGLGLAREQITLTYPGEA
jgi:hypothetical protein